MAPWLDLACWVVAGALGLAGAPVVLAGLFGDRPRGRRRCPSCWYDMAGVAGRRCPECGREQASERRLLRTRRRWRMAAGGALLMLLGYATWSVPEVRARGWWAAVPRPVLALMIASIQDDNSAPGFPRIVPLELEIRRRFTTGPTELRSLWPGEGLLLRLGARWALNPGHGELAERLAAELWALQVDRVPEGLTPHGRARMALALSRLVYARCASYRDVGMVLGKIGTRDEKPFMTVFERGGRFRYEFLSGFPSERTLVHRYVVWGRETELKSWWTLDRQTKSFQQRDMALSGPAGVSGGSASRIPRLLDGGLVSEMAMSGAVVASEERFDGHPCLVIRGTGFRATPYEVWLDFESLLIRKVCWSGQFNWTTVYRPELNPAIDPSWFEFDPAKPDQSPLGDGEEACRDLRGLAGDK